MILARHHRKGFTLIEMLIVGALIVLFAGLAMIAAQQVYDDSKRKAVYDETHSIMTAMGIARQDLGFYPRIYLLGMPLPLVRFQTSNAANVPPVYYVRPAMDNYGYYSCGISTYPNFALNPIYSVGKNWHAPYTSVAETRAGNSGAWRNGIVKVRLSDREYQGFRKPTNEDLSLVTWPADVWGNPYAFYQVTSDAQLILQSSIANPKGLRMINSPIENGEYFTAVVSYGPNGVPGGNKETQGAVGYPDASMFVKGDMITGGPADFTLKSVSATGTMTSPSGSSVNLKLDATAMTAILNSLTNGNKANPGIVDPGSDDIIAKY